MKTSSARHRRGDSHPTDAHLVFHRYKGMREAWVTPRRLEEIKAAALRTDSVWRKTPLGVVTRRRTWKVQNQKPGVKKYRSEYYKQPHVRKRYRERYANDPSVRAKVKASSQTNVARAAQKRHRNKPEIKARTRTYMKQYLPRYHRERGKHDPHFRLTGILRHRIWLALKNQRARKNARTEELIGCSFTHFRQHIEGQFQLGMTWENMGHNGWEIDHRVPLAAFNLADPEQQKLAFNFHNQRPMWRMANRAKNDLMEHDGETVRGRDLRKRNIVSFPDQRAIAATGTGIMNGTRNNHGTGEIGND